MDIENKIHWECSYCLVKFEFISPRQKGGHITNCKQNPNRQAIISKISKSHTLPRIEHNYNCKKCNKDIVVFITENDLNKGNFSTFCSQRCSNSRNPTAAHKAKVAATILAKSGKSLDLKDQAIQLRAEGHGVSNIAKNLGVNGSLISGWVANVVVNDPVKAKQFERNNWKKAIAVYKLSKTNRLLFWKKEAEELFSANQDNRLFNIGLGLYWGEGGKTHGSFSLSNSDPALAKIWLLWVKTFATTILNMHYSIYAHNDVIENDAIEYWKKELNLVETDNIKLYRCNPTSSKNLNPGKCKFGTMRIAGGVGGIEWSTKILHMFELISKSFSRVSIEAI